MIAKHTKSSKEGGKGLFSCNMFCHFYFVCSLEKGSLFIVFRENNRKINVPKMFSCLFIVKWQFCFAFSRADTLPLALRPSANNKNPSLHQRQTIELNYLFLLYCFKIVLENFCDFIVTRYHNLAKTFESVIKHPQIIKTKYIVVSILILQNFILPQYSIVTTLLFWSL